MEIRICPVCGKEFSRPKGQFRYEVSCCSRECRWEYQRGKKQSPESNEKRRLAMKGHVFSKEHNLKISRSRMGMVFTQEHRDKISTSKTNPSMKTRERISTSHADVSGENNPRWKGGISEERSRFTSNKEWKRAVWKVWKRDAATCQRCGKKKKATDESFHVHHLISFEVVELRSDVNNLVLLCPGCHRWVHSKKNVSNEFIYNNHQENSKAIA